MIRMPMPTNGVTGTTGRPLQATRLLVALALGAACAPAALAHEDMPVGWCTTPEQPEPRIIGQFAFTPVQLAAFRTQIQDQAQQQQACPKTVLGIDIAGTRSDSCGIVDDWHYANQLARRTCRALTPDQPEEEAALHFVAAPADFNNGEGHHTLYRFADGTLTGQCVVCSGDTGYSGEPGGD